jgi:hypothetical protein
VQHVHSAIILRVPHQLVVVPQLLNPHIRRHDLITQVLNRYHAFQTEFLSLTPALLHGCNSRHVSFFLW